MTAALTPQSGGCWGPGAAVRSAPKKERVERVDQSALQAETDPVAQLLDPD